MKKIYTGSVFFIVLSCLGIVSNSFGQTNFYVSQNRSLSAYNLSNCRTNNSCAFYVGWDGSNSNPSTAHYFSNITLSADVNCSNCIFYSVDNTDRVYVTKNISFSNTSIIGGYLVIPNGVKLTLGGDLDIYTASSFNSPNSHFTLPTTIIVGNQNSNANAAEIDLNGNDLVIHTASSSIYLGSAQSLIDDRSSNRNGNIIYQGQGNNTRTLFSANGNNPAPAPNAPYNRISNNNYTLSGLGQSSIITSGPTQQYNFTTAGVTPLPIVLSGFNVVFNADKTGTLSWTTQQEANSSYFSVERSADGINWESIGIVDAKGNTSLTSDYTFIDKNPLSGINYYRLKAVDLSGNHLYSSIQILRSQQVKSILVFPNPARSYVNVSLNSAAIDFEIRLLNPAGQLLQVRKITKGNSNTVSFPVQSYTQGTYLISIKGSDGSQQISKVLIAQ